MPTGSGVPAETRSDERVRQVHWRSAPSRASQLPPYDVRLTREIAHRRFVLSLLRQSLRVVSLHALDAAAVIVSAIGIRGHETFPPSKGAARAVMALAAVLVAFTMFSAVITG